MADDGRATALVQIQPYVSQPGSRRIPLILFHDGGGTIYQYFLLPSLSRSVWGIQNPFFESGKSWAGRSNGLRSMAKYYLECIKAKLEIGPIILGGWSFGGNLALEVANLLRQDAVGYQTIGMVFIDTCFPLKNAEFKPKSIKIPFQPSVPIRRRVMVQRCMDEAVGLLHEWHPEKWPQIAGNDSNDQGPPPTILLRAKDRDHLLDSKYPKLGWEQYDHEFFRSIVDIDGHHFNLFDGQHINMLGTEMKAACDSLEKEYHQWAQKNSY